MQKSRSNSVRSPYREHFTRAVARGYSTSQLRALLFHTLETEPLHKAQEVFNSARHCFGLAFRKIVPSRIRTPEQMFPLRLRYPISAEKELIWAALVCQANKNHLTDHVIARCKIEHLILNGELRRALDELAKSEVKYGHSIWST